MKKILILGAGLSSTCMIDYLLSNSDKYGWKLTIGDIDLALATYKSRNHPNARAIKFDINDQKQKEEEIKNSDVVISFLPAVMHPIVADTCLNFKKHLITASYVSPHMKSLHDKVVASGLCFWNELGVDPGIDHMSAMKIIHKIQSKGGKITSFKSSTGGLIAPESDNNPWNYKFTWNPRNVVLAGSMGTAKYLEEGKIKYIPYHKLFERTYPITIPGLGDFEVYANRDSLSYRQVYGLNDIKTIFRGTIRRAGFCKAWNTFIQLGATDDSFVIENSENLTCREFINLFLAYDEKKSVEEKFMDYLSIPKNSDIMKKMEWLGIFSDYKPGIKNATPAQFLQKILEEKWKLEPDDKDMIVMQHEFEYILNEQKHKIKSSLIVKGKDKEQTAMALTVGLPVAIATKLLLTEKVSIKGVVIPVDPQLYEPILNELEEYGIKFIEEEF